MFTLSHYCLFCPHPKWVNSKFGKSNFPISNKWVWGKSKLTLIQYFFNAFRVKIMFEKNDCRFHLSPLPPGEPFCFPYWQCWYPDLDGNSQTCIARCSSLGAGRAPEDSPSLPRAPLGRLCAGGWNLWGCIAYGCPPLSATVHFIRCIVCIIFNIY